MVKQGTVFVSDSVIDNYVNVTLSDGNLVGSNRLINRPLARVIIDIATGAERSLGITVENHGFVEHGRYGLEHWLSML